MATISNEKLEIENVDDITVKVTISYDLVPNQTEKLARTVFKEELVVQGDDAGTRTDLFTFPDGAKPSQYAVDTSTATVSRSRDQKIPKSTLNEDPDFLKDGSENLDEILAQITISYAANAPTTSAIPAPKTTPIHKGAWV
jgi:hypothetical protein